ncbi:MAG: hypothetical protein KGL39_16635 [Patescibacteria group bacterium]|nr:hypothetical protein [Patescibacteria group bacterium]
MQTDTEISYALAKAIGWRNILKFSTGKILVGENRHWYTFDYRDPAVWAGLVEGYGLSLEGPRGILFPVASKGGEQPRMIGETYAEAVALLVIELAEQGKLPERRA